MMFSASTSAEDGSFSNVANQLRAMERPIYWITALLKPETRPSSRSARRIGISAESNLNYRRSGCGISALLKVRTRDKAGNMRA